MNKRYLAALSVLLLLLLITFVTLYIQKREAKPTPQKAVLSATESRGTFNTPKKEEEAASVNPISPPQQITAGEIELWVNESFDSLKSRFLNLRNLGQRSALLIELKSALLSHPERKQIKDALIKWLHNKEDFTTGLKFRPGKEKTLRSWDSGRIFALDVLSQIDLKAANDQSWEILESEEKSPSETIFSLKCIAQYEGRKVIENQKWITELQHVFAENIENSAIDPSVLYGLDLLVFSQDANQLEFLSNLQNATQALQRGWQIAAKRMVINHPTACFEYLLQNEHLWQNDPNLKGLLFGYANPSDPHQAEQIEQFMTDPQNTSESVTAFLKSFPNFDRGISYNLLTESKVASMNQAKEADKAALDLVNRWIEHQSFPAYESELLQAQRRLMRFVNSAQSED